MRHLAVTPSPAGFLVIPLDGLWEGGVDNIADVGFVNAHSESDGGTYDLGREK